MTFDFIITKVGYVIRIENPRDISEFAAPATLCNVYDPCYYYFTSGPGLGLV